MTLLGMDPWNLLARGLLAFGGVIVLPLGLHATAAAAPVGGGTRLGVGQARRMDRLRRLAFAGRRVAWLAGLGLAVAQLFPAGWRAACLALPWALLTSLVALEGLARLRETFRSPFRLEHFCLGVGASVLVVGGAFALAFRAGVPLLGYSGTQCLLTANHFTYAGFGASTIAGLVGLRLREHRPLGLDYRLAAAGTSLGVPLVALGIFASRRLEVLAAWCLAGCIFLLGLLMLQLGRTARSRLAALLFVLAGASSAVGAGFAAHFALTGFSALDGPSFQRMVLFHGLVNAVGFVGAGMAALALEGD